MTQEEKKQSNAFPPKLFTSDGKPIKVLSTSLGVALLAGTVFGSGALASGVAADSSDEPKLVSWSSEEVKAYFDANVDWSLPLGDGAQHEEGAGGTGGAGGGNDEAAGGSTVVHHYGSGFGWDDLLLYHLLFNRGAAYSSAGYYANRPAYHTNSNARYTPKTYGSDTFQNRQVAGSAVRPKTSSTTGSITRRATSSQPGGIGGRSSGLSSGSSASSGVNSSKASGFGG